MSAGGKRLILVLGVLVALFALLRVTQGNRGKIELRGFSTKTAVASQPPGERTEPDAPGAETAVGTERGREAVTRAVGPRADNAAVLAPAAQGADEPGETPAGAEEATTAAPAGQAGVAAGMPIPGLPPPDVSRSATPLRELPEVADARSIVVSVGLSTISGMRGTEGARLERSGAGFTLQYHCTDAQHRASTAPVCDCTELQKEVSAAQVADLFHHVATTRDRSDANRLEVEVTLRDRTVRRYSVTDQRRALPEIFEVECE